MRMRALLAVVVLSTALVSGCLAEAATDTAASGTGAVQSNNILHATVSRHTDGDTAWFMLDSGSEEKVRFIGMDTPEVYGEVEEYGAEASAYTADALPIGREVWLETDVELRDQYDRLLAYVWLAEPSSGEEGEVRAKMLNARLLLDGYAMVSTYPPNVRYVEQFTRYQEEAREAQAGLWGSGR